MFFVGGVCFLLVGLINEWLSWETPLVLQMLIAAAMITLVEFLSGCVLNIWLGLEIWDYSHLPFNLLGQVSLLYSFLWYILSAVGIVLDDYFRYFLFGEGKPKYKIV